MYQGKCQCGLHIGAVQPEIYCSKCGTLVKLEKPKRGARGGVMPRRNWGVGTEISKQLEWFLSAEECQSCMNDKKRLDNRGVEWCEQNHSAIVDMLMGKAKSKGLPSGTISRMVASRVVTKAIKRAKAHAAREQQSK